MSSSDESYCRISDNLLLSADYTFTPDTILGWFRKFIAEKYDGSENRTKVGRPRITDQIVSLGYKISKSTIKNILIENGYDPEPDLTDKSSWHEFIKSHWEVLAACDFFTIELLVGRKLIRCTVFFAMELCTRKMFFAPVGCKKYLAITT